MVVLLVQVSTIINKEIGGIHALFKNWMSTRQYYNNHKKKSNHGNNNNYYLLLSLLLFFCRIYEHKTSKMYIGKFNVDNAHFFQHWVKIIAGFHTDFKGTLSMNMQLLHCTSHHY
mgnify:FL=1